MFHYGNQAYIQLFHIEATSPTKPTTKQHLHNR